MAGIDKTYTDSYVEYKKFKDWADKQKVVFFDGYKVYLRDYVWEYSEVDFKGDEIPIMNTPAWMDAFLIQNCKIPFVLDRMKSVHSDVFHKKCMKADFTKLSGKYKQNRKIKIKNIVGRTKSPLHSRPYGGKSKWWLQSNDKMSYNDDTNVWASSSVFYPTYSNVARIKSVKGIVRHLRKQYLPSGICFTISGRYVGEEYLVTVGN